MKITEEGVEGVLDFFLYNRPKHREKWTIPELTEFCQHLWQEIKSDDKNDKEMTIREGLTGAIARGWCSKRNENKIFDPYLAEDISKEIITYLVQEIEKKYLSVEHESLPSGRAWNKAFQELVDEIKK